MSHKAHYVSNLNYHIVFCTKFRLPFLKGKEEFIKKTLKKTGYDISDLIIDPEHIHLVVKAKPSKCPDHIVHDIKQMVAYHLVKKYDEIKEKWLWGDKSIFTRGYFISTIGDVSKKTLKQYLKHHESN